MPNPFVDLTPRLVNWRRWCWKLLMEDAPASFAISSIYEMGPRVPDDGFGVIDGNTVLAPQPEPAQAEQDPIDDADAESLDFLIAQLPKEHRICLHCHYVLRNPRAITVAVRALAASIGANQAVHERMKCLTNN